MNPTFWEEGDSFLIQVHYERDHGRMVMPNNCKIITALLRTLSFIQVARALDGTTLEWQPHQLVLQLRVCELHVETEFV